MPGERIQGEIDRLLDQISDSLAGRDWQAALESAEAALSLDPQNEDTMLRTETSKPFPSPQVRKARQAS